MRAPVGRADGRTFLSRFVLLQPMEATATASPSPATTTGQRASFTVGVRPALYAMTQPIGTSPSRSASSLASIAFVMHACTRACETILPRL